MFIIVLNQSNIIEDGTNSTLRYRFPTSVQFKKNYIAVSSVSMYYSWFNILSSYNNNKLSYTWTSGGVSTTHTITIPDGLYEIATLNDYFQFVMVQNGHYLISDTGQYVYYFDITVNVSRYAIQLNTYKVPNSLPAGYTTPSNFAGFPTETFNPVITFPSLFNDIVGYTPVNGIEFSSSANIGDVYVPPLVSSNSESKNGFGTLSYLSNTSPNVQPNSSLLLSISGISNHYTQPSTIAYSISPTVAIGQQIIEKPPNFVWNRLIDGTYNELVVKFLGVSNKPINIRDREMTIILTIKDMDEQ